VPNFLGWPHKNIVPLASLVSLLGRGRRLWMNQHLYWCHLKETPYTSEYYNCPIVRLNQGLGVQIGVEV